MPKAVEVVIAGLFDEINFNTLIIWAELFDVEHDEYTWSDDEWPDKESELRQRVTEAAITIFEKGYNEPSKSKGGVSTRPSLRMHGRSPWEGGSQSPL